MMKHLSLVFGLILSVAVHAQQQIIITCPECGHAIKVSISVDSTVTAVHDGTSAVSTIGQCKATTAKGTQCSRKAQEGSEYCWQHASKAGTQQTTTTTKNTSVKNTGTTGGGRCRATTKSGNRCSRTARSNGYCWQHGG